MPLESTLPAKLKLDAQLWKVLESAIRLSIHRTNSNTPWNCVLPIPVMERSTQTFQESVVAGQAAHEAWRLWHPILERDIGLPGWIKLCWRTLANGLRTLVASLEMPAQGGGWLKSVTKPGSTCQEGTWVAPNAKQIKQTSLVLAPTRQAIWCMDSRFAWPRNESHECWIFRRCRSISLSPFTCLCWTGWPSYQRCSGGQPLWRSGPLQHHYWGPLQEEARHVQDETFPNVWMGRDGRGGGSV